MTTTRARKTHATPTRPLVIDVYCRISRAYDDTLRSVDAQEVACRRAIEEHDGWVVGHVFRDHATSAWNPKTNRPEFNDLMARLESGQADGVMVRNIDRFTRKVSEGERLLRAAKQGCVVTALDGTYDLTSARGCKNFREDMVDAAYESDRISERTTNGKRQKALRGKSNASYRGFAMEGYLPNPVGWEAGDPRTPVPIEQLAAERDAVAELARMLLGGATWAAMTRHLNDTGLRTAYGNDWNPSSVRLLLMRPSLAGIHVRNGEEVGTLPGRAALDRETFDRVQSVIAARAPGRRVSERYLLTNLIACGHCGHLLTGRPRTAANPYPDGEVARQYWCQKQVGRATGCGRLSIDQRYADQTVARAVLTRLGNPQHAARLARHAAKAHAAKAKIDAELDQLNTDRVGLAGKVATWGADAVDAAMQPLLSRITELVGKRDALDVPEGSEAAGTSAAEQWGDGDVQLRRLMIRSAFPNGITIRPATSRGKAGLTEDRFDWGSAG